MVEPPKVVPGIDDQMVGSIGNAAFKQAQLRAGVLEDLSSVDVNLHRGDRSGSGISCRFDVRHLENRRAGAGLADREFAACGRRAGGGGCKWRTERGCQSKTCCQKMQGWVLHGDWGPSGNRNLSCSLGDMKAI